METKASNVVYLTTQQFKEKVFNYNLNKEWKYEGTLPAIIDFYADWCGPCKMVAPILNEIANDYAGKLIVYKVDTESEQELAAAFGISSIPTLLFVPVNGQPQAAQGALPRSSFDQAIKQVLQVN
jgi:thioredoxin 1